MSSNGLDHIAANNLAQNSADAGDSVDLDKLITVLRKSWLWIIILLVLANVSAYLFIRYTKPLYESVSDLKLDIKSESDLLGIQSATEFENISGEIEILKSKLFFNKVIDATDMEITYNFYGNILNEERYSNSPFQVDYEIKDASIFDRAFELEILSQTEFTLSYQQRGAIIESSHGFGEDITTDQFDFRISVTSNYNDQNGPGNYYFIIHSREALLSYLERNLDVVPVNLNAKIIRVSFRDYNRNKAKDLVNAIDTLYLKYTLEEKNKATVQQIQFINEQLRQTEHKLAEFEDYFENFTIDNKTTNLENDIGKSIELMEEIDKRKYELQTKLVHANLLKDDINSNTGIVSINPIDAQLLPPNLSKSLMDLNTMINEKELLLGSHNENTYVITKKDQEIMLQKSSMVGLLNDFVTGVEMELRALNEERVTLERSFQELPSLGTEYSKNKRHYNLYEGFYLSQIQKKAEFEIAQAGMVTNFVILSSATLPSSPIYPTNAYVYGLGIVVGLFLGFLFIGLRYLLHNKITSSAEVEKLTTAPFLGVVPEINASLETKLIMDQNPKSAISEALRTIRTNLEFMSPDQKNRVISVTSTISGEGKTFISVNLGAIIALTGVRVLVMDLDLRKPKVHLAFGNQNSDKGISTALIHKHKIEDCIRSTDIANLYFVGAGPSPPNPSELILSEDFDRLIEELKKSYDLIIMDTPPVGIVSDAILAMKKADLPIYIIRADYSKREFVKNLNRLIHVNNFKSLAVILNSVKLYGKADYGYSYGYQSGYFEDATPKKRKLALITHLLSLK